MAYIYIFYHPVPTHKHFTIRHTLGSQCYLKLFSPFLDWENLTSLAVQVFLFSLRGGCSRYGYPRLGRSGEWCGGRNKRNFI